MLRIHPPPPRPCPNCRIPNPNPQHPQFLPGYGWTTAHLTDTQFSATQVPGLEDYPEPLARLHLNITIRHLRTLTEPELAERCYSPNLATAWTARQGMLQKRWPIPPPGLPNYHKHFQHRSPHPLIRTFNQRHALDRTIWEVTR